LALHPIAVPVKVLVMQIIPRLSFSPQFSAETNLFRDGAMPNPLPSMISGYVADQG